MIQFGYKTHILLFVGALVLTNNSAMGSTAYCIKKAKEDKNHCQCIEKTMEGLSESQKRFVYDSMSDEDTDTVLLRYMEKLSESEIDQVTVRLDRALKRCL